MECEEAAKWKMKNEKKAIKIYRAGWRAMESAVLITEGPYKDGTVEHYWWILGWQQI